MAVNSSFVDQLNTGRRWLDESRDTADTISWGVTTNRAFASGYSEYDGWSALTSNQRGAVSRAIDLWDDVLAVDFIRASDPNAADIKFSQSSTGVSFAHAYYPGRVGREETSYDRMSGSVWLKKGHWLLNDPDSGSYGQQVILHEIGHTLGLGHAGHYNGSKPVYGDTSTGWKFVEDSWQYTVMSYFDEHHTGADWYSGGSHYAQTPMVYDIYAAQEIYGANTSTRSGSSVYGFNSNLGDPLYDFSVNSKPVLTIWDAGGRDRLDLSGLSSSVRIDLAPGSYSDVGAGMKKNVGIAYDVVIEDATGGSGNDEISGNSAANHLVGGDGADELYGLRGDDRLEGGAGDDYLAGGAGKDILIGGSGYDIVRIRARLADVSVKAENGSLTVKGEGSDKIYADVELIRFNDVSMTYDELRQHGGGDGGAGDPDPQPDPQPDPDPQPTPDSYVVVEAGTVKVDHNTVSVQLDHSFTNPVVFALTPTTRGGQEVAVRISNITGNSFDVRLDEGSYRDGPHLVETLSYVVVEAGRHELADGTIIEAGTIRSNNLSPQGFESVSFSSSFDAAPAVLTQVQSLNDSSQVWTRQQGKTDSGFKVAMQEAEAFNGGGHATETIGWLAIETGAGEAGGLAFEAGSTSAAVNHNGYHLEFDGSYGSAPLFLGSISSYIGADPASLRQTSIDSGGVSVFVQEDQSNDSEVRHYREKVDYLVIESAGQLMSSGGKNATYAASDDSDAQSSLDVALVPEGPGDFAGSIDEILLSDFSLDSGSLEAGLGFEEAGPNMLPLEPVKEDHIFAAELVPAEELHDLPSVQPGFEPLLEQPLI